MATQPRRLLFLISRFLDGGIDTVLVEYLRHLSLSPAYQLTLAIGSDMGTMEVFRDALPSQVAVVHLVSSPLLAWGPKARAAKRMRPITKVADELMMTPLRRAVTRRKLDKLVSEHDVIVDFDCCFSSYLDSVAKTKVAFFHFTFALIQEQDARRMRRLAKRLQRYDHVVLLSKAIEAEGKRLYPELASKFTVIYNPKDPARLRQQAAEAVDNALIGQPYILAVERLTEPKDMPTLLRAFALLRNQHGHGELKLVVIGKGEQMQQLQQLARDLALADSVVFMGFVANPYPWVAACQLMVFSSKSEGLGMSLVEAMLLDRPIVATDCPTGPREVLADGKAGLLTPVGDAQAMADAMHRMLTDDALRQQQAEGRREQAQLFTFDTADRQLSAIFGINHD